MSWNPSKEWRPKGGGWFGGKTISREEGHYTAKGEWVYEKKKLGEWGAVITPTYPKGKVIQNASSKLWEGFKLSGGVLNLASKVSTLVVYPRKDRLICY